MTGPVLVAGAKRSDEPSDEVLEMDLGCVFRCCREFLRLTLPCRAGQTLAVPAAVSA